MTDTIPVITDVDELLEYIFDRDIEPGAEELRLMIGRVGRNAGPAVLESLRCEDLLTHEAATALVGDVWSSAEYPEDYLGRADWLALFTLAGYTVDGKAASRPASPMRLYRGCPAQRRARMSWTSDLSRATWFAQGGGYRDKGVVWTALVGPERLLCANLDSTGGRGEAEYVINPDGLDIQPYASAEAS